MDVTSSEENDFVQSLGRWNGGNAWIGLQYVPSANTFLWVSTKREGAYNNWQGSGVSLQSAGNESCAEMDMHAPGAKWKNTLCSVEQPFVCKTGRTDV